MAIVWAVRDGSGDHKTVRRGELSLHNIATALQHYGKEFLPPTNPPPNIGGDEPADGFVAPRHVVVEVTDDEHHADFPKPGYYLILGLRPRDVETVLGV